MNRSLYLWQIAGFLFVSIIGTLLHFTYDLSAQNFAVALFSAVNESVCEHMKLFFFPVVFFALIEYFFWGKQNKHFWSIKLRGVVLGIVLNIVLYYLISGAFGISSLLVDVVLFYVIIAVVFLYETYMLKKPRDVKISERTALILLCVIALCFVIFTFLTPQVPLFEAAGTYGI